MQSRIGIGILACALLVTACASSGGSSAARRATRLNESKARGAGLVAAGDYEAALEVLVPLSQEASGDAQVFLLLGEAHEGTGATAEAIRDYEQSIRLAYTDPDAHLKLATLLMRQEKIGRALTEFQLAIEYGDGTAMAHYNYGLALHRMGRTSEALEQWRRARELDEDNPVLAEAVGIGLTGLDPSAAVAAFRDAEQLGATGAVFHNNYGLALEQARSWSDAQREFRAAVSEDPGEEPFRFNLAAILTRRGQYAAAATEWEGMGAAFGAHWSYSVYLARCYLELGRFQDALRAIDDLASQFSAGTIAPGDGVVDRIPPGLDEALVVIALSQRGLGRNAKALDTIRRAVDLSPDNASHLNNYGVILAENGMLDQARAQWRKVLEIDPGNATAKENLSALPR